MKLGSFKKWIGDTLLCELNLCLEQVNEVYLEGSVNILGVNSVCKLQSWQ